MPTGHGGGRHLDIPDAPPIDGLRFRTYLGADDIPGLVDVYRAAGAQDGRAGLRSEDAVRVGIENWSHLDPTEDLVVATVGDRIIAAVEIEYSDTADGDRHYHALGHVHPEWRRRGIGEVLMTYSEGRRTRLAETHDVRGHKILTTWLEGKDEGGHALVAEHGYRHVRTFHNMVRPNLDEILLPDMPDGLEVRQVTKSMLPQLFEALIEAFADHFGGQDGSAASYRRWAYDPILDPALFVVGFDGEAIAGGVLGYIDRAENEARGYRRGWADPIFTRPAWRRRGLASALLGRALTRLRDAGMTSAQLDVDGENANAAVHLYTRHGFEERGLTSTWHRTPIV